jgi:hypothetical protein
LRERSERVVRGWYEGSVLGTSREIADVESRIERVERAVRRLERVKKQQEEDG